MEIRFKVNQAEAFRRGVSVPKSIVRLEIDPAALDEKVRHAIADRLDGIDVCAGYYDAAKDRVAPMQLKEGSDFKPRHLEALLPTFEALVEAIEEDQARIDNEKLDEAEREQRYKDAELLAQARRPVVKTLLARMEKQKR